MQIDIWLKRIWLVIGVMLLLLTLISIVAFVVNYFSSTNHDSGPLVGPKAQPTGPDKLIAQDISFDPPNRVGRTDLYYIGVRVRDLTKSAPASAFKTFRYSEAPPPQQDLVNIVFTKRDGSGSYPLLEKRAFLKTVDIPSEEDSLQSYNLYDISFIDTDNDGRITGKDSSQLFISDLSGEHLTQVTAEGDELLWFEKSTDWKQIFILVKQRPSVPGVSPEDWPERLYAFNIKSHTLSPFPTSGESFDRIRKMLWSK